MQSPAIPITSRRSSRVPMSARVLVTSLKPEAHFSEVCETLVVSAHGCALRSPARLEAGIPVQFHSKDGRKTTGYVVDCQPIGSNQRGWRVGATLDHPANFWGLKTCPEDWAAARKPEPVREQETPRKPATTAAARASQDQSSASTRVVLTKEHLRTMVADFIQPLSAELTQLKEKLAEAEPKRSRFEVSLSQIPPELQEQLWTRLRQALGAQVVLETRKHSEEVLSAAKTSIGESIAAAKHEFRQHVTDELHEVERRAQDLSENVVTSMRQHLHAGAGAFQQQVAEAGAHLEQRSEELLRALQQRMAEDHDAYGEQMRAIQVSVESQSARLQAQISDLGSRIAKLDEFARRLESDVEIRLGNISSEILANATTELESVAATLAKELATRNAKQLGDQLDEALGRLKIIQKGIEASSSESLNSRVAEVQRWFVQAMEELAQHSVERWRQALGQDLTSLGRALGQQFRLEDAAEGDES